MQCHYWLMTASTVNVDENLPSRQKIEVKAVIVVPELKVNCLKSFLAPFPVMC